MHMDYDDDEDETRLVAGHWNWLRATPCGVARATKKGSHSERMQPGPIQGHVDDVLFPVVRLQAKAMLLLFRAVHRRAGRHRREQRFPHGRAANKWCQRNACASVMSSHSEYSSSLMGGGVKPPNQTKAVPQLT